jgi:ABC-type Zn2+ transport system substrate-binding protein/surface adhesin
MPLTKDPEVVAAAEQERAKVDKQTAAIHKRAAAAALRGRGQKRKTDLRSQYDEDDESEATVDDEAEEEEVEDEDEEDEEEEEEEEDEDEDEEPAWLDMASARCPECACDFTARPLSTLNSQLIFGILNPTMPIASS